MIELDLTNLLPIVIGFALTLARTTIFVMIMPIVGSALVPAHIKIILSMIISIFVFSIIPIQPPETSILFLVIELAKELFIGLVLGLVVQVAFQVFILAGQLISMQSGLGFASIIDPQTGNDTPFLSQLYLYLVSIIFFLFDGHLALISFLVESFRDVDFYMTLMTNLSLDVILIFTAKIFSQSVLIVLPAILALLIANIAFALLAKIAPQLNMVAVGFPITLAIGLVMVLLSLSAVTPVFLSIFNETFDVLKGIQ